MMKRFLFFIKGCLPVIYLSVFHCFGLSAQNIVLNPSFEDYVQCPKEFGTFQDDVLYWTCPTNGSTDYFNSCSTQMALQRNFAGKQIALYGQAYGGFYAFGPKDYREYIGGELKVKLEKTRNILFQLWLVFPKNWPMQ